MKHERGRPFDSGLVGKPCKRCGDKLTQHHKIYGGYCGHCNGAIHKKALNKINNLWDKVTDNG